LPVQSRIKLYEEDSTKKHLQRNHAENSCDYAPSLIQWFHPNPDFLKLPRKCSNFPKNVYFQTRYFSSGTFLKCRLSIFTDLVCTKDLELLRLRLHFETFGEFKTILHRIWLVFDSKLKVRLNLKSLLSLLVSV